MEVTDRDVGSALASICWAPLAVTLIPIAWIDMNALLQTDDSLVVAGRASLFGGAWLTDHV